MMRLWVSDDHPMPGDTITICITIEWMHFGWVEVTITNPVTNAAEVHQVDLDIDGHGCFTWQVPSTGWVSATISNAASDDLSIIIG